MARRRDPHTADLLSWQPTTPVDRFDPQDVRGATLDAQLCKAMKVALTEAEGSREEIAAEMSRYLGQRVSPHMLNAYVSPARDDHIINVVRFIALIHATKDRRLLELIAELFGCVVVDAKYLDVIQEAELAEKREELSALAAGFGPAGKRRTVIETVGEERTFSSAHMKFVYRNSGVDPSVVFTRAVFRGRPAAPEAIRKRMDEVQAHREAAQPIREKTGGSTFKNPPGHSSWKLIDAAGCRGLKVGGAQVSQMHCNFLINTGDATGHDIEMLGEAVRAKVKANSGIELHWEIKRIGVERA